MHKGGSTGPNLIVPTDADGGSFVEPSRALDVRGSSTSPILIFVLVITKAIF
jgi:hypothetical protein